jgi:hypothetical protein
MHFYILDAVSMRITELHAYLNFYQGNHTESAGYSRKELQQNLFLQRFYERDERFDGLDPELDDPRWEALLGEDG